MNLSDVITQALLDTLNHSETGSVLIKRNELASQLGCVPSQINYVITSRFTPEHGYIIESRRGGGGYIKIIKIRPAPYDVMMHVINSVGDSIDEQSVRIILENLNADKLITDKERRIVQSALSNRVLKEAGTESRDKIRADLLKSMLLNCLD